MFQPTKPLSFTEFVALIAFMISIVAMSIDIMLPALGLIADDLNVADRNDAQLVVSLLFAGFAVGQLIAGPVSDTLGRKNTVFIGYGVFIVGCLLSLFATGMEMMLLGRVLQGLGAAAPRIVTLAMVRDLYGGRDMARVMSTVMAVFVIVPAAAPVIALSGWHATFVLLIVMVVVSFAWLSMRQPEPLPVEKRRPFSAMGVVLGFREVFRHPAAIGYTLCAGFMFGGFLGYLSSSQQVFQDAYGVGDLFPYYFGVAALALGGASVLNSRLVMRLGMRYLAKRALITMSCMAVAFLIVIAIIGGLPPLWLFMVWLVATFFCFGLLFGNINALAMEPLGHLAGFGAAVVGAGSTFVSLPLGWLVGHHYDGGVEPVVLGFAGFGFAALVVMIWTERLRAQTPETQSS